MPTNAELGPEYDPITLTEHIDATLATLGMSHLIRLPGENDDAFDRRAQQAIDVTTQTARTAVQRRRCTSRTAHRRHTPKGD